MSIKITPCVGGAIIADGNNVWKPLSDFRPCILDRNDVPHYFDEAECVEREYKIGVGVGFSCVYTDFPGLPGISVETRVWLENSTQHICYEFIPLQDGDINEINWPAPFEHTAEEGCSVLPFMQGCLLKNYAGGADRFDGSQLPCSRGMYMRMFAQYNSNGGYLTIVDSGFDCGLLIDAKPGKPVSVSPRWLEQIGKIARERRMHIQLLPPGADYNEAAALYREYIKEQGELVTLKEKIARKPKVAEYIGQPICHTGSYRHIEPASIYYIPDCPENNDSVTTFAQVGEKLTRLHDLGVEKLCLHLDGWHRRGYDNLHPDALPPAEKAGGWSGLAELRNTCHRLGYNFGIHDQFRDYFYDCDSFDLENAARRIDGTYAEISIWFGGRQTILCAKQALAYVHRNYDELETHDCKPDNAYLDVFSCVEPDECFNPAHLMTREECTQYRAKCFNDVSSRGIVLQSEEGVDWAIPYLDFVHHAPFALQEDWENHDMIGIGIPLEYLVYHDCLIMPLFPQYGGFGVPKSVDGSLLCLLYGCGTYIPDSADEAMVAKVKEITEWQKKVQLLPMLRHSFLEGNKQRCEFAGGYSATIDFENGTYELVCGK